MCEEARGAACVPRRGECPLLGDPARADHRERGAAFGADHEEHAQRDQSRRRGRSTAPPQLITLLHRRERARPLADGECGSVLAPTGGECSHVKHSGFVIPVLNRVGLLLVLAIVATGCGADAGSKSASSASGKSASGAGTTESFGDVVIKGNGSAYRVMNVASPGTVTGTVNLKSAPPASKIFPTGNSGPICG